MGGSTVIWDPGSSASTIPFKFMASILMAAGAPATVHEGGRGRRCSGKLLKVENTTEGNSVFCQCHRRVVKFPQWLSHLENYVLFSYY